MDLYIFINNCNKRGEEIVMEHFRDDDVISSRIGNIYNLIDYINYNINDLAKIKLVNFTGNKLEFIVNAITRYKSIVSNEEYYSLVIKNKIRVRGK